MAAALSLSLCLDPQNLHNQKLTHLNPNKAYPFLTSRQPLFPLRQFDGYNFRSSVSSPCSSADSASPATFYSFQDDPLRVGRFLSNEELEKLKALESFVYFQELESGSMWVRAMRPEDMDSTVRLLAESFAESMSLQFEALLRFLVKQYLIERRGVMPHAVTLVGFFRERGSEEGEEEVAGTVEVCFDKRGANASPPTPTPPKNSPYICNMTVRKPLRRKGIGWHLLKASEELISNMTSTKEVYLHCRMIDTAPFNMYIKAGYEIVRTDSILSLLMLQRRKHLMCKMLPVFSSSQESDMSDSAEELPS
ncbi:hypothetical protein SLE2022_377030 [Rubroshorea leprosula]